VFPAVLVVALCFCLEQRAAAQIYPFTINTVVGEYPSEIRDPRAQRCWLFPYVCPWTTKGNVYIADTDNNRVRKVAGGKITTIARGREPRASVAMAQRSHAQLDSPSGMAIDSAGNIYIYDVGNLRIRKVDANGIITTVAGNGTVRFHGDGGPATAPC